MKRLALALGPFAFALSLIACCYSCTQDDADSAATESRMKERRAQVGLCKVTNFTEAKFANLTCELRDQEIRTWSYYLDLNGGRHLICESVGYGLPYAVQTTNPMKTASGGPIPQAEPNGLFMPSSADATWVLCSDGKGGVAPVYVEPRLIVSPFPLGHIEAAEHSGFADKVSIEAVPKTATKVP